MMIDFNEYIAYEDCKHFWFVPATSTSVYVVAKLDEPTDNVSWQSNILTMATVSEGSINIVNAASSDNLPADTIECITSEWELFKQRPEFQMIYTDMADDRLLYETQLAGSVLVKEFKTGNQNPDKCIPKIKRCLEWLHRTDFYVCPASTQYHDSCLHGLLTHSLTVCDKALALQACDVFSQSVALEDAIFVALVHDWCKIGLYQSYMRNVKDPITGQWDQVPSYKYVEDRTICLGHGVSSLYMVMKFFNVSMEVALAIRWHMGRWNVVDAEINELQQANRNHPLVHLIQFADQLSIVNY